MPGRFKGNFDYQFVRTMGCVTYGGAALGECYETASRIEDEKEESYSQAWRVTAERVEAIARKSLIGGHLVSAREAFLRASSYWREVGFFQLQIDPKCRVSWERQRDCFIQAGKLMDLPFEMVNIPYENGRSLPGYFLKADASDEPRPTLMSVGGVTPWRRNSISGAAVPQRFGGDTTRCCSRFRASAGRCIRIRVPNCFIGRTPRFR